MKFIVIFRIRIFSPEILVIRKYEFSRDITDFEGRTIFKFRALEIGIF